MIGHSILHGGPGIYGLSPAVVHYLAVDNLKENPPSYSLLDVADVDLRGIIGQVCYIILFYDRRVICKSYQCYLLLFVIKIFFFIANVRKLVPKFSDRRSARILI